MDLASKVASEVTVYGKYAKYVHELKRRETWDEIVDRYQLMLWKKYCPIFLEYQKSQGNSGGWKWDTSALENQGKLYHGIKEACDAVRRKEILPSMRGLQFAGTPIERNNSRIYNCFGAETRFITKQGVVAFADLTDGQEVEVRTHTGQWQKAVVKSYGKQKLCRLTFARGRSKKVVRATLNHTWLLQDGSRTQDIRVGDKLFKTPDVFGDFIYENAEPLERVYWAYGFVFGDGTRIKNKNGDYAASMVRLCGEDVRFLSRFEELGFKSSSPSSLAGDVMVFTGKYLKTEPDLSTDSPELIRAFVAGYLDADGTKNTNRGRQECSPFVSLQTSSNFSFVEKAFETTGCYISRIDDLTGQETNFKVRGKTYRYELTSHFGKTNNCYWSLVGLEELNEEELVWCLEVENDKSFTLSGGMVTGNCAFMQASYLGFFRETMFLLLGGTGVGYSVQDRHVRQLPTITKPRKEKRFNVQDSIEGWADAVDALFRAYFKGKSLPRFDFSDVRPKGMRLITAGGKAPGPGPLRVCLDKIRGLLETKPEGTRLTSVEVSDLACIIADAVLSGGIRRAAMICLFDITDAHMLAYKVGSWWELHPERARVNVSAVAFRGYVSEQIDPTDPPGLDSWHEVIAEPTSETQFKAFWKATEESKSGEPGIYWSNHPDWGTNPCCEIGLRHKQFCNLTTINFASCTSQETLCERTRHAAFLGTLQAGFTDMHYLGKDWEENCRKDALLGVSLTGIGDKSNYAEFDFEEAVEQAKKTNSETAERIGIQKAARISCIKPEGTASLVLGCASGVHGRHSDFYIRRFRFKRNESVAQYFAQQIPDLVVEDKFDPDGIILELPQKSPQSSINRSETALETLERLKFFREHWVAPGHYNGCNTHNVSCTVSVRDCEWVEVGEWMFDNRDFYNGIAVLPWDGGSYIQAPFEDCDEETYNRMLEKVKDVDLTQVFEEDDSTNLVEQVACAGGACTI